MTTANPDPEPRLGKDGRLVSAMVAVALSGGLMAITAAVEWGPRMAVSVGTGASIAASNLYILSRIVHAMTGDARDAGGGGTSAGAWGVIALGKMMVLFGGIWFLMTRGLVDPMGLVVGYGSLPIGIAIGSIVSDKA